MNTTYDDIIESFLGKITEYDWYKYTDSEKDEIIEQYMISACSKWRDSGLNLKDRDDINRTFNIELTDEHIDIITTGMIVEWLKPKLYNSDKLKAFLNTKDFNLTSPQGILSQIREVYNEARIEFKVMKSEFSFNNGNVNEVVF